jgi:hypothetical protein
MAAALRVGVRIRFRIFEAPFQDALAVRGSRREHLEPGR